MPFGMGPAGWLIWPYWAQWMYPWYPGYGAPYAGHPGYGLYYPPPSREQELGMLRDQAKIMEDELARIRSRIDELQTSG
jgi:hypothetical protein